MPELPDVDVYVERLSSMLGGLELERARIRSPFLVRTVSPKPSDAEGRRVATCRRVGKRIVVGFDPPLYFVIHLMIAGRLRWRERDVTIPGKLGLAAFDFPTGSLLLTEAGTRKRASLHVEPDEAAVGRHDPGGLEVLDASEAAFGEVVARENHTLKRTLTDPRLVSGIGNAYSDEILHRAQLSPLAMSRSLDPEAVSRLYEAARAVLVHWRQRLREEVGDGFPEKVTAFRPGMAVHGRYGEPCPDCGSPVQRIVYASNETNYCATCQTGGRLLADRGLSRLLKKDWPRTLEELELLRRPPKPS